VHSITCTNYWTLSSSLGQHLQRFTIVKRDQVPCHPNHPVTVQLMWRCKKCNSWWFDTGGISPNFFSLFSLKYMLCYVSKNSEMSFFFYWSIFVLDTFVFLVSSLFILFYLILSFYLIFILNTILILLNTAFLILFLIFFFKFVPQHFTSLIFLSDFGPHSFNCFFLLFS
jgi:hypothetical protein